MQKIESNAINIARFILIIGVVFIHLPLRFTNGFPHIEAPLYKFISSRFFLMDVSLPGLFLISGYLFFYKINIETQYSMKEYFGKIKSRITSIVVPYLFWNVFWLIYTIVKNYYLSTNNLDCSIDIDSFETALKAFWAVGQGEFPNAPIATYTWFLRDLFMCTVLSPFYYYVFMTKNFGRVMFVISAVLLGFPDFDIPLIIPSFYIGGYIAFHRHNIMNLCNRINWLTSIAGLMVLHIVYYIYYSNSILRIALLIFGFILVFKLALRMNNNKIFNELSKASTYLYLTHIFIINMGMHLLFSLLRPHTDIGYVSCFLLNLFICIALCISSFYLLKKIRANTLLKIVTGGRF